jgi:hypothetical protein
VHPESQEGKDILLVRAVLFASFLQLFQKSDVRSAALFDVTAPLQSFQDEIQCAPHFRSADDGLLAVVAEVVDGVEHVHVHSAFAFQQM